MKEWTKIMQRFADNLVTTNGLTGLQVTFNVVEETEPLLKCGMTNFGATVLVGLTDGISFAVGELPAELCFMFFNGEIIVFEDEPVNIC